MASEDRISDEAVRARTGKRWAQWFTALDRWGAAAKGHRATAAWLAKERGLTPWWSQTVTVRYELERGLRARHERSDGFEVSATRLVTKPPARVFDAITKPADLSKWFTRGARARLVVGGSYSNRDGDRGRFLAVARPKRLRMTWENPNHCPDTIVEFTVARAPSGKTQVRVTHERLASRKDATKMKEAWSWALDSLRSYVQTGAPIPVEEWERERRAKKRSAPKKPAAAKRVGAKKEAPSKRRVARAS
ncbi:MAG TPA: SRPBCC family protein [Acidobacteriota bacterium]|nr:SRPBCC family protein [Acidobacteriota bacterium]